MKRAVIYANTFGEVANCMKYAEGKGYQVVAMTTKCEKHNLGDCEKDVVLIATGERKNRTYEEILLIEKMESWYDVEVVAQ